MRLFYLFCTAAIGLILLVLIVAQFGASCTWLLLGSTTSPVIVLLLLSLLGAFMGAFFILFLLAPKPSASDDETLGE